MEVTGRLTWLRRSCGRRAVGCRATTAANGCEAARGGTQAVATRGGGGSADAWAAEQRRGDRRRGNVRALGQADGSDARRRAEKQGRLRRRSSERRHAEAAEQRKRCRAGSETQRGRGWATVQRAGAEARQRVARRRWQCGGERQMRARWRWCAGGVREQAVSGSGSRRCGGGVSGASGRNARERGRAAA
jgi:hypothetical protein